MKLKNLKYRDHAILLLKEYFYRLLRSPKTRNKIVLEAPTGSGKTVTIACLLRDLAAELPAKEPGRPVTYIWIAPNQLHLQSYKSLDVFFEESRIIRTMQFNDITEGMLGPNDLLFLNWQSISSADNILVRDNENGKTLYSYVERSKQEGIEVIVILDEAHLFGTTGERAQEVLEGIDARIEIDVSATPKVKSKHWVAIPREEVVAGQMIKKGVILNPGLSETGQGALNTDLVLLRQALEKRNELAERYRQAGTSINPLLLIQLPSDNRKVSHEDSRVRHMVTRYLAEQGITEQNERLAVWLSEEKIHLDDISKDNSAVDVLLFKQAIAQGWDCPRAAVLLIYRELRQQEFTVQTLGRILRMPGQKHYADEALNTGYVFTNLQRDFIKLVSEEMDYITFNRAVIKKECAPVSLPAYYAESNINRNRIGWRFREALFHTAEKEFSISISSSSGKSFYHTNFSRMEGKGVIMKPGHMEIEIPSDTDLEVSPEETAAVLHKAKFVRTAEELELMFDRFCLSLCGDYAKDGSWERIKYHLKLLFLDYFGLSDNDAYRIVLANKQVFTDLLNLTRGEYTRRMNEQAKTKQGAFKEQQWQIPEWQLYNNNYIEYYAPHHILQPLFLRRNKDCLADSKNEFEFIRYLEEQCRNIEWWYKNGSGGKTDFAIPYINTSGTPSLFYVDIIIRFKNGTLGFFDPKSGDLDKDLVQKHNALTGYIDGMKQKGKPATGGVIIQENGSWRYSTKKIKDIHDKAGWEVLRAV